MKERYFEIANEASLEERKLNWNKAYFLWKEAIDYAYDSNICWAKSRLEYCHIQDTKESKNK
ncbi:ANR family transcriptional regulator [Vibrio harveyi]